jgi:hypothetical protein
MIRKSPAKLNKKLRLILDFQPPALPDMNFAVCRGPLHNEIHAHLFSVLFRTVNNKNTISLDIKKLFPKKVRRRLVE